MPRSLLALVSLLLVLAPLWAQTAEQKRASIDYVRKLNADDGGFVPSAAKPGEKARSSLRATSAGLRALRYLGGEPADPEACKKFVAAAFDADSGGFRDMPGGKQDVATTAVGLMALVELKMPAEKYTGPAVKYLTENAKTFEEIRIAAAGLESIGKVSPQAGDWLQTLSKMRNEDGSYGKGDGAARDTASGVVTVLRLGGKVESPEAVLKVLNAGQREDGGFGKADVKGSDLETTYRVVRCYVMLKGKPDVKKCLGFVAKCRNDDGGYGVEPGKPSNVSATYFAAVVQHWLAEKSTTAG